MTIQQSVELSGALFKPKRTLCSFKKQTLECMFTYLQVLLQIYLLWRTSGRFLAEVPVENPQASARNAQVAQQSYQRCSNVYKQSIEQPRSRLDVVFCHKRR